MLSRDTLVFICATLCGIALSRLAYAQEDDLDSMLNRSMSSATSSELRSQASAEPPKTEDKHELSVFYHKRGMANYHLGNYSLAIPDLRLALQNNQPSRLTPQEWGDRWRIQADLGSALWASGEWFAQIEHWKEFARERRREGFNVHLAHLQLARALLTLGDFAEAEKALRDANALLPQLRNTQGWMRLGFLALWRDSSFNAMFKTQQGDLAEAERLRRLALDYAQKNLDLWIHLVPRGHQGIRGAASNVPWAKVHLAEILATRGKYGEAELFARAGLEDWLQSVGFNTGEVSYALAALGLSKLQQQDLKAAQRYYRYAITALERSGAAPHSTQLAGRRAMLANAFVVQSRWQDALKVLEERDQGLRADAQQFTRFSSRHVSWALALVKTGEPKRAADMVEGMIARETRRSVPNKHYLAQLHGVLGMAHNTLGNLAEALRAFQDAVPVLTRNDRGDATSENSGTWRAFWRRIILESYIELLAQMQTAGTAPATLDMMDEAFRMADLARGSSVQEAIGASAVRAQLPDASLVALVRKDQDTLNRIDALNKALGRLAAAAEAERLNKVIADMQLEIERSRNEHSINQAEIRKRFPEYAELVDPRPPGLADVRKALSPAEALVSIYLGETQAYVWTIGTQGKTAFRLVPVTRAEVEADVAKLRRAVEFGDGAVAQLPAFDLATAEKLYRTLLGPDETRWKDASVLNIIPHGALGQLPFGLLVTAPTALPLAAGPQVAYRDAAWLVRKVALAQLPSTSAFAALRRAPPATTSREPFVGFGNPMFRADAGTTSSRGAVRNLDVMKVADRTEERLDVAAQGVRPQGQPPAPGPMLSLSAAFNGLSALPDTAQELNETAATLGADANRDVYVGRRASETNVKHARLEDRRVVAFATHGIAPGELAGLDQPALVLSNPALTGEKDEDGFLTMEEVLGLKLDADWVVLSACNTASADGKGSEAVSGLGRAFFYAGARSLLVSNWAVETTSARLLTTELFRRQSENPALTRAEALRYSMLALMDKTAPGSAGGQPGYSYAHPAFWAPFTLVGDSGAGGVVR